MRYMQVNKRVKENKMKGTLTFNLPEERQEFQTAVHAGDIALALWEIENAMRSRLKYSDPAPSEDEQEFLTQLRLMISEVRDKVEL